MKPPSPTIGKTRRRSYGERTAALPGLLKVSIISVYVSAAIVRNKVRRFIAIFFIGRSLLEGSAEPVEPRRPSED
jgi:hypothetical protein